MGQGFLAVRDRRGQRPLLVLWEPGERELEPPGVVPERGEVLAGLQAEPALPLVHGHRRGREQEQDGASAEERSRRQSRVPPGPLADPLRPRRLRGMPQRLMIKLALEVVLELVCGLIPPGWIRGEALADDRLDRRRDGPVAVP